MLLGVLGLLNEEAFTRHSQGGQDGVHWFLSSLFLAWLLARKWGTVNSARTLGNAQTRQMSDASEVAISGIHDTPSPSPGPSAPNNKRNVGSTIVGLLVFAVAWYVAKEVVTYVRTPSPAQINAMLHDALVKKVTEIKSTLPQVLDEATTLRDIRVDGLTTIYINEIHSVYQVQDIKAVQDLVTPKVCASPMRAAILDGASYRYEYWSAGTESKPLGAFNITSCR